MTNLFWRLTLNLGLLVSGIFAILSGFLLQGGYHLNNHGAATNDQLFGLNYYYWSVSHKFSVVTMSLFVFCHVYLYKKWYKAVVKKRLFAKNKQVLTLSLFFFLTAITGFSPWIFECLEGSKTTRTAIIEIHDKLTIFLIVYLILHISKRFKWFKVTITRSYEKEKRV